MDAVVSELIADGRTDPESLMLLGAECRDILHRAYGHKFRLRGTSDLDVAMAVADWDTHEEMVKRFGPTGNTGIRYSIAGVPVDLMPFGSVEDPRGEVTPRTRSGYPFSVFAFQEVFESSLPLVLPSGATIRIPSAIGYSALKVRAWRDRWTASYNTKDGPDIATVVFWYSEDEHVTTRLYETTEGIDILSGVGFDATIAAAKLLGRDTIVLMGEDRAREFIPLWQELDPDALARVFGDQDLPNWPTRTNERRRLVDGLTDGLLGI